MCLCMTAEKDWVPRGLAWYRCCDSMWYRICKKFTPLLCNSSVDSTEYVFTVSHKMSRATPNNNIFIIPVQKSIYIYIEQYDIMNLHPSYANDVIPVVVFRVLCTFEYGTIVLKLAHATDQPNGSVHEQQESLQNTHHHLCVCV